MNRIVFFLIMGSILCSCSSEKIKISGTIEGLQNSNIVLNILDINAQKLLDTITVSGSGSFSYVIENASTSPNFYYLFYKDRKLASLILAAGDNVKIVADTLGVNTSIEGSDESILLAGIEENAVILRHRYDSLLNVLATSQTKVDSTRVNYDLGGLYIKQKQNSIKEIYSHPNSMTNITLLYQRFPGDIPIFAETTDHMLFQRVYDSLSVTYPNSIYLSRLKDEIDYRRQLEVYSDKLANAQEASFPNILLPDTKSKICSLDSLAKGKVVILSFWTVTDANQKMMNLDMLSLYNKYHEKGLEIYQVSVDADKTAWATTVREQELPWVSVCDGLGTRSSVVSLYNVQKVPTNFILDRDGTIIGRDIFDKALEDKIKSLIK